MSRDLPSWAQRRSTRPRPRLTLPADLLAAVRQLILRQRPAGAPARTRLSREISPRAELIGRHLLLRVLSLRFDIEFVGSGNLDGLRQPFVFGANEQGAMDYHLFRLSLRKRLRPTMIAPSRALARGRNVVVFTDDPQAGRLVGEFSPVAAGLANQHNVAIVPIGLVGTFKLNDLIKLPVSTRPKVSIRIGAPIYVRGRRISQATAELQGTVEQLVHEGDLSWWDVEKRRVGPSGAPTPEPIPRWRRLWDQAAPAEQDARRIWS